MSGAHLHLIINHAPVVGSAFALLLLAWAFAKRSDELKRAALGMAILVAVLTIPTYLTGEPAWEDIMGLPGDNDSFIESHERAAKIAFGSVSLMGVMAVIALVMGRRPRALPAWLTNLVLLLLLATAGLMSWVAHLGGKIRHTEIRHGGVEEVKE